MDPENVPAKFEVRSFARSWDNSDWSFSRGWRLEVPQPPSTRILRYTWDTVLKCSTTSGNNATVQRWCYVRPVRAMFVDIFLAVTHCYHNLGGRIRSSSCVLNERKGPVCCVILPGTRGNNTSLTGDTVVLISPRDKLPTGLHYAWCDFMRHLSDR